MKKIATLLLVMILGVAAIYAEPSKNAKSISSPVVNTKSATTIKGTVYDSNTNETLAGVSVLVNGEKTYTDLDGNFEIQNVNPQNCEITVKFISYEDQTIKVNNKKDLDIKLKQF